MLVVVLEDMDHLGMSYEPAVSRGAREMKLGTVLLLLALATAPACGGGGGSDSGTGSSGGPLLASFIPDQATPGANTVAMAQGPKNNDVVTVYVTLTDTNGAFGAAFEVVFDSARATYLGYGKGAVFEQGGDVPNYTVDGTTNPGRVVIAVARSSGTATNIAGSKAILSLQLRVKEAGTYPVTIENGIVYNAQSPPQPIAGILWFAGALQGV
jgi:hypothetical protein